jgi:hypothetical protein
MVKKSSSLFFRSQFKNSPLTQYFLLFFPKRSLRFARFAVPSSLLQKSPNLPISKSSPIRAPSRLKILIFSTLFLP